MSALPKTAIVTGSSQGIGAALVTAFLDRHYNVVANSRHITKAIRSQPHRLSHSSMETLAIQKLPQRSQTPPYPASAASTSSSTTRAFIFPSLSPITLPKISTP